MAQLVFQGDPDAYGQDLSPWIEMRIFPKEEIFAIAKAQKYRRFIKTHSPINCIPFKPEMEYLFIDRDARDVAWSMYNHHKLINPEAFEMFNNAPGLVGERFVPLTCSVHEYYLSFLETGCFECQSNAAFWPCIQSWWDVREQPNIMFFHFNNLKTDFEGEARRVAEFLEIDVAEETWPSIIKHCHIDYMRELAKKVEALDVICEGGGANFINKGTNERWKDVLSQEEIDRSDDIAVAEMGKECAQWLKTGELS